MNTGIEFILDENNTYGDFVSLVNDMAIARHEIYGLDINKTGHFFVPVFYKNPDAKNESSDNEMMIPIDAGSLSYGIISQIFMKGQIFYS
ncbi:hypothetical protein FY557_19050 [Chryseobacterium sp. SN22]|uniref:hypothetical protein n=1 Tax=Chryseobacterium sp. SN22 TaxID=2606431 RepID=UPI0011EC572D|nr:hypothetical protein [Chryseobacterium sp. SN22]KAA0126128.1 hypothetical protein FY557_19050 [Chryseobacterium sp. SN22]